MSKEIIVVDSQRLNMIQNCEYKYDLTFNKDLIPIQQSVYIEEGDLIHQMLRTYYTLRGIREKQHRSRIPRNEMKKICMRVGEVKAIKLSLPIQDVDDTFRVFNEYIEYYWDEPHQTILVEKVGSKILYEDEDIQIIYEAKMDWICSITNCPVLPVDHKSSRRRGPIHEMSNQFMGYCWMLDVRNIMVNKIGFQTTVKPAEKFQRPLISYSLPVLENWARNSAWWVINRLKPALDNDYYPQNLTSCDKYNGCIFQPICLTPPNNREEKMRQLFNTSESKWDVGASL